MSNAHGVPGPSALGRGTLPSEVKKNTSSAATIKAPNAPSTLLNIGLPGLACLPSTQSGHPGGAGGSDGSGRHKGSGSSPVGSGGQLGGGLNVRLVSDRITDRPRHVVEIPIDNLAHPPSSC